MAGTAVLGRLTWLVGEVAETVIETPRVRTLVSAGIVVRCPDCKAVSMRVVESPERTWIDLQGVSSLQIAAG